MDSNQIEYPQYKILRYGDFHVFVGIQFLEI